MYFNFWVAEKSGRIAQSPQDERPFSEAKSPNGEATCTCSYVSEFNESDRCIQIWKIFQKKKLSHPDLNLDCFSFNDNVCQVENGGQAIQKVQWITFLVPASGIPKWKELLSVENDDKFWWFFFCRRKSFILFFYKSLCDVVCLSGCLSVATPPP